MQLSDPQTFVAFDFTVVVPMGNNVPGFCEYVIAGAGLPVALALKLTTFPQESRPLFTVILTGHVIFGAVFTVNVAAVEVAVPQVLVKTARY